MASAQSAIAQRYQQSIWGGMDRALRNCFIGSAILGVAVLIAVFVVPVPIPEPASVNDIPERIARLILEQGKPAAPAVRLPEPAVMETPPEPVSQVKPPPRRRTSKPKVSQDKGFQGRQKAQKEVTQNLAQVTGSLDQVLDNLSKSLPASDKSASDTGKRKPRRRRGVRSGRSSQQISSVQDVAGVASPDLSRSAIQSEGISIDAISDLTIQDAVGDVPAARSGDGRGGAQASPYRSNESLLAVVRRYAPGIQFCYDNELKKNPNLRGKLVVSITVLASGKVSEALVVEDSLGSPGVTNCVLSQIRGWQLPAISHGVTRFKTPFVFTPPK
jgi:outer membrane biosynthesis protein TonB